MQVMHINSGFSNKFLSLHPCYQLFVYFLAGEFIILIHAFSCSTHYRYQNTIDLLILPSSSEPLKRKNTGKYLIQFIRYQYYLCVDEINNLAGIGVSSLFYLFFFCFMFVVNRSFYEVAMVSTIKENKNYPDREITDK